MTTTPSVRARLTTGGAVIGIMIMVALVWFHRLEPVLRNVGRLWDEGGSSRLYATAETALFLAILGSAVFIISTRVQPLRDLRIALAATGMGWLLEWWGTTEGLWNYFTFEQPPVWIVFAWPIGGLMIDRAACSAAERWSSRLPHTWGRRVYLTYAAAIVVGLLWFSRPAWDNPVTWLLGTMIVLGLTVPPVPRHGVWIVLVCFIGLFWADVWGTSSECWSYYFQRPGSAPRQLLGILSGTLGNTGVVILSLRLAGAGQVPSTQDIPSPPQQSQGAMRSSSP